MAYRVIPLGNLESPSAGDSDDRGIFERYGELADFVAESYSPLSNAQLPTVEEARIAFRRSEEDAIRKLRSTGDAELIALAEEDEAIRALRNKLARAKGYDDYVDEMTDARTDRDQSGASP